MPTMSSRRALQTHVLEDAAPCAPAATLCVRVCVCVLQVKPKAQQSSGLLAPKKGNGDWVMKTPERRRFCLRQGLAQRYWFSENVGKLPFKSKALAASVGSAHPSSSSPYSTSNLSPSSSSPCSSSTLSPSSSSNPEPNCEPAPAPGPNPSPSTNPARSHSPDPPPQPRPGQVGCSVAELNKRPLDPLAIDVVFDALARSKAAHRRPQPYPKPPNPRFAR